jgi:ketosteroid isomerase-like protein
MKTWGLLILLAIGMGYGQDLRSEIIAQERAGLEALKIGDVAAFGATIAEDAVFVDASGPAGKAQVVKNVAGFRLRDFTMSDIRFVALSADTGLIVYVADESGISHGREFSLKVYVSSIWRKKSGKWLCEFSQETAARQAPKASQ